MVRQSISLTKPNDDWLKSQISNEEFTSKSELVNYLIRQERKKEQQALWIRNQIEKSEKAIEKDGFVNESKESILNKIQAKAKDNGFL